MFVKRFIDLTIVIVLSPILLVFMPIISIMVFVFLGFPVFFTQERPGYCGTPFKMYKFRTMNNACDLEGNLLPDEMRMTWFGKFLRKTSIDELPEVWNVLKGEMSIVGPRPLLMEYLPKYSVTQARRHEVKPGITGWAQINGRNSISWDDKLDLDIWYVDNRTLLLDVQIIFKTILKVLKGSDVTQEGHATTEKFQGSSRQ